VSDFVNRGELISLDIDEERFAKDDRQDGSWKKAYSENASECHP